MVLQGIVIVGVHGLSQLHHDIVRHVDDVADRTDPDRAQFVLHPGRRRHNPDVRDDAVRETAAQFRHLDFILHHVRNVATVVFLHGHVGQGHRFPQDGGSLPGDAGHAEAVLLVGRQIDIENRVIKAQDIADIFPYGRIRRQDENALPLFRQEQFGVDAQFVSAAEHAVRRESRHLDRFQFHAVRQGRADRRHGHHVVQFDVLGARLDLDKFPCPLIKLANPKMIRFRIPFDGHDFARHDAGNTLALMLDSFHFEADAGQFVRQFFRSDIERDVFFQPFNRS